MGLLHAAKFAHSALQQPFHQHAAAAVVAAVDLKKRGKNSHVGSVKKKVLDY